MVKHVTVNDLRNWLDSEERKFNAAEGIREAYGEFGYTPVLTDHYDEQYRGIGPVKMFFDLTLGIVITQQDN